MDMTPSQPPPFLAACLADADKLNQLEDNWDGEGSTHFLNGHVERVKEFILECCSAAVDLTGQRLPVPDILPGPARAIDIHWKDRHAELLACFPERFGAPVTFYGDVLDGSESIQGKLDPSGDVRWFALWIVNHFN
jgi:hypothetical protein